MLARSHVIVALSCVVVYKAVVEGNLMHNLLDYFIAAFAALLPDIDEHRSYIGRRFTLLALPIKLIFGHRGVTHSLLVLFILGVIIYVYGNQFNWVTPFVIGYASHLLADYVTNGGIPLFYPSPKRYRFFVTFNTGSWVEYVVIFCISLTMILFVIYFQSNILLREIGVQDPEFYKMVVNFLEKINASVNL